MQPENRIITRFAPSPTGYLHVGGARTALFCWLLARHHGTNGTYLLRIEDTDLARSTQQAVEQLVDDLRWLGLHWDNTELVYQSKRVGIYNELIDRLIASGQAYKAYESADELAAMRKQAEQAKKQFIYRRGVTPEAQTRQWEAEGRPHVVRFAMPVKEYRFRDEVLDKDVILPADECQDFVIRKADGMPTYHFAVVVDDAEMNITHVLRGQEHLKNTFNHIALQEALGFARPKFGHLPVIMNLDNSKMSKRDRDKKIRHAVQVWCKTTKKTSADVASAAGIAPDRFVEWVDDSKKQIDLAEQQAVMRVIGLKDTDLPEILVHDFRQNGYIPEALLNFLALLGWNPGGDRERMTMDELVSLFSLGGIGKSNAKFDRAKLLAFNTETAATMPLEKLLAAFKSYLAVHPESPLNGADDGSLSRVLRMKKGFRLFGEVEEASRFFFIPDEQIQYDPAAIEKVLKKNNGEGLNALKQIETLFEPITDWTAPTIESAVKQYCESKGENLGKIAQPLRVATSGTTISPPIFESLEFLGKAKTMNRIRRCQTNT